MAQKGGPLEVAVDSFVTNVTVQSNLGQSLFRDVSVSAQRTIAEVKSHFLQQAGITGGAELFQLSLAMEDGDVLIPEEAGTLRAHYRGISQIHITEIQHD